MRSDSRLLLISLPPLPDEAAVQILDFLHELLLLFETHYGDQIHRYYEDRSYDNIIQPDPSPSIDDPPF